MRKIKLSNRARKTPASPIRSLSPFAEAAKKVGTSVLHLNIGQPDISSPAEFFEGVKLFNDKILAYDHSKGNYELRSAWSTFINNTLALDTTAEQFIITTGASEALVFLFMTCCDPGDEVIIFDPTYANYIGFAAVSGVDLVPVLSNFDQGFALPPREDIENKITNRTRAILLCNPNNPTGTVYTRKELQFLLNLCEEHDIFLIVDETYREFVYDGLTPLSVLQLELNNQRVIVVDSLSKRYSLCGARIGCLITSNEEVLATTLNIATARLAAPTLEQAAAAHMLRTLNGNYLKNVKNEYEIRRNNLFPALVSVPGISAHKPSGAFYTIVRLPVDDVEKFASFMLAEFSLNNKTVFIAPAAGFYMQNGKGKQKARIAYVLRSEELEEAVNILEAGLKAYQ